MYVRERGRENIHNFELIFFRLENIDPQKLTEFDKHTQNFVKGKFIR